MTVSKTADPRQSWNGDDVTVAFNITTFSFIDPTHVVVQRRSSAGALTTLTKDAAGDDGYTLPSSSTTITMNTAPATGETLIAYRNTLRDQLLDMVNNRSFNPENVEAALDKLTYIMQEISRGNTGAVRMAEAVDDNPDLEITELAADRASKYLAFDSNGDISLVAILAATALLLDEDDMASNDPVNGATQQSIVEWVTNGTINMANKLFKAATCLFADATDLTKKLGLSLSGATTGKTMTIASSHTANRTLTLPNATDTLVGKATTDTLTNKTLTSPVINTGVSGSAFLDEDDMSSDSATKLSSQQAIKAYVDSAGNGILFSTQADVSGSRAINTEYTNSTGRTMMVQFQFRDANVNAIPAIAWGQVNTGGGYAVEAIARAVQDAGAAWETYGTLTFFVPPGANYKITGDGSNDDPTELYWNEHY